MVVLTVGNAYLLCIADAARIDAVNAELATSKVSLDQATAAHEAGTSPRLDVLRAQVDYQNEQQTLISTTNQLAKDKLALARTIGLPLDQEFRLTDTAPYAALDNLDPDAAFAAGAQDPQRPRRRRRAGRRPPKRSKNAAFADQLPDRQRLAATSATSARRPATRTAPTPPPARSTRPILQIAKTRGEEQVADAQLRPGQRQALRPDPAGQRGHPRLHPRHPVRRQAGRSGEVQRRPRQRGALSEAQQRFHAGVADNLPVSQAQAQTEQANDQYISALYQHNVAKLSLARALGVAQTNYKDYLGGK